MVHDHGIYLIHTRKRVHFQTLVNVAQMAMKNSLARTFFGGRHLCLNDENKWEGRKLI